MSSEMIYESKQIVGCNLIDVKVGTTGYCGGDGGHGGRTMIQLNDGGGTCWEFVKLHNEHGNDGIRIALEGDSELTTIIEAFRYAADTLEKLTMDKPRLARQEYFKLQEEAREISERLAEINRRSNELKEEF